MLETTREDPTPLQRDINGLGRALGIAVIAITLVVVAAILLIPDVRTPLGLRCGPAARCPFPYHPASQRVVAECCDPPADEVGAGKAQVSG